MNATRQQQSMFYDLQGNLPLAHTQNSYGHQGHPWPGLLETTTGGTDYKAWAKENALYLAGGGLIVAGLAAWKFGWLK